MSFDCDFLIFTEHDMFTQAVGAALIKMYVKKRNGISDDEVVHHQKYICCNGSLFPGSM